MAFIGCQRSGQVVLKVVGLWTAECRTEVEGCCCERASSVSGLPLHPSARGQVVLSGVVIPTSQHSSCFSTVVDHLLLHNLATPPLCQTTYPTCFQIAWVTLGDTQGLKAFGVLGFGDIVDLATRSAHLQMRICCKRCRQRYPDVLQKVSSQSRIHLGNRGDHTVPF